MHYSGLCALDLIGRNEPSHDISDDVRASAPYPFN
jgi:hypothetical protein